MKNRKLIKKLEKSLKKSQKQVKKALKEAEDALAASGQELIQKQSELELYRQQRQYKETEKAEQLLGSDDLMTLSHSLHSIML